MATTSIDTACDARTTAPPVPSRRARSTASIFRTSALTVPNLTFALVGCLLGTAIGVLPGLGPAAGTAILIPLTFSLDATGAIIMLAAIYYGAMYGGTITSVLINVPGEAASVVTCLDGHEMARQGRRLQLFIEVNTGEEPQKAGVLPKEVPGLLRLCREELKLDIAGLMCIPPVDEAAGIHFAFLAKLAKELGLAGLSMGMSADFETAIKFGATHVRVGSEIFGHRG